MGKISFFGNTKFRKRMNLSPGVSANFGKTGASISVGTRGCKTTFGKNGARATVGIPGTGISGSTYRSYNSKRKQSSASSNGRSVTIPIRTRKSNMVWGFTFLILSLAIIIFSFVYPDLWIIGRWIIAIFCGGFLLIGAIVFFTAKSKEDYEEEISDIGDRLNILNKEVVEIKSFTGDDQETILLVEDIDLILNKFFEKKQEYGELLISHLKNISDIEIKEKALLVWNELQNQIEVIDNLIPQMLPRQLEYYQALKPTESYIQK